MIVQILEREPTCVTEYLVLQKVRLCLQNLYVKTLTFNSMVLRNGGFERELDHEGGAPMIGSVSSSERERREPTLSLPCEDTARTRLFAT